MSQAMPLGVTDRPPSAPPEKKQTKKDVSARIRDGGLIAAPFLIAALAGVLYVYYQSLDLANAKRQQRSALAWSENLVPQIQDTLIIAFFSTVIVIVIAVPLGILLTRASFRRVAPGIVGFANAGQAIPAYGLIVLALIIGGQGKVSVVFALALYALLPVLRNTMVGLEAVDRSVIEAGRGMGMTHRLILTRIELPLAVPIIVAGIRTAVIINIGMSTLAYLIGGGGLGITISSGIKLSQNPVLIVGAVLVAIIALTFDWLGAVAERFLHPRGL
ncbi:ABC transporter permease [Nocardioides sp.]|uniref:ABC transporter permease n=1 Tax=Nocardioides sp. TaxID=35761 RepID=UPI002B26855A|nr:ABC transporter permease [Nocardioides sp.]